MLFNMKIVINLTLRIYLLPEKTSKHLNRSFLFVFEIEMSHLTSSFHIHYNNLRLVISPLILLSNH